MKKHNWSKLPNEILLNIFQSNDNNTNSQCSLTCRDWKYIAQCALFEKISILSDKQLIDLSNTLSIYQNNSCSANFGQSPGNYVKIVNCWLLSKIFDWELLDRLFPFLETINTSYKVELPRNDLYKLLKEGKFQHLKNFPTDGFNMPSELLLDRREKIEELKLQLISLEDKILQNLHLFSNLKKLDLEYFQEVHLEHFFSKEILHLNSIIIKFGFESDWWGNFRFRNLDSSLLNIDYIQSFPDTKELQIYYPGCFYHDDKYILYIMKKFPNLESLSLFDDQLHRGKAKYDENSTIDCLFQFLVYCFKMKKSSYANMITNNFTNQLVKKFLTYVIDQQTVCNTNMIITLMIKFRFLVDGEQDPDYSPDFTEHLDIDIIKSGRYKKGECKLSVRYHASEESTFQSHLQLFQEVRNMRITRLTISALQWIEYARLYSINLTDFSSIIPVVLDEIFSHFSKLEYLEISHIFHFIWNKEVCLVKETLNSTIKYMEYYRCTLSKDMFPVISRICPNLKTLSLLTCRYTNSNEDKVISRYFPILMSSTCLEELVIELVTDDFPYKKVFIRMITNNKKPRYCKITTESDSPIINFPEQDCTEVHYNMCLDDEECGVFDIHCEAVVKLNVRFMMDTDDMTEYEEINEVVDGAFWNEREYIEEDL